MRKARSYQNTKQTGVSWLTNFLHSFLLMGNFSQFKYGQLDLKDKV